MLALLLISNLAKYAGWRSPSGLRVNKLRHYKDQETCGCAWYDACVIRYFFVCPV
jgi:hypothetical protein